MTASWILEVRRRLAATAGPAAGDEERAAAVLVPLFVAGGQLWTVLTRRLPPGPGQVSPMAFPGALVDPGEEPWEAARRGGRSEAGLEPRVVLPLGRLPRQRTPAGLALTPWAGALPAAAVENRRAPEEGSAVAEVVTVPLGALAAPQMVESRPVELAGRRAELTVYHVGRHRLWGVTARIAGTLLAALGESGPLVDEAAVEEG